MPYTNKTNVENYLKRDLADSESNNLELLILAASQAIDAYTGRTFSYDDGTEVERYYDGSGKRDLIIDDFTSITSIELVDIEDEVQSTYEDTDWIAYPLNDDTISRVRAYGFNWPTGQKNIKITGVPGYRIDTPEAIQLAATMIVANYLTNPQNLKQESIEGYSRVFADSSMNQDICQLLDSYKRVVL